MSAADDDTENLAPPRELGEASAADSARNGRVQLEPGMTLGPYTLEARLGRGSMGEVWRAAGRGRQVALKVPLRPAFLRHLRKEGLLLATVEHPNVARFYEADLECEPPWLATELATGQPLRALCRGTITPAAATLICDQILAGLQAIHAAGILHLDLKPENVIVPDEEDGQVKIVDLGLGRATSRFMEEVYLSVSLASRVPQVAGTLAYMSPEQRKGKEVDPRADLFAFGILLHELLAGDLPAPGTPLTDLRAELTPRWDVVVSRLTHPLKERRPKDAREARHLVSYTLTEKNAYHTPEGGHEPRDLLSFDEEAFAAASPYAPGMVIGEGYELELLLGRGGFGEVWRARRGEERVALKLILGEAAREGLEREVEVAQRIAHPGVPRVLADHSRDPVAHVVFELVQGTSLRLTIHEEEQLPLGTALAVFEGMLEVVKGCADAQVVHMDLKPEHFLVDWEASPPRVSLIDFGLAALVPGAQLHGSLASRDAVRGTLDYMAPEQRAGQPGPQTDVYALGLCLFELLVFSLPKGPQSLATLRRDVPHEVSVLAGRMLNPAPSARPSLARALTVVREARRSVGPARRRWPQRVTLSLADQLVQAWSDLPRVAQRSLSALLVVALLGLVLVPALRLGGDRDPRSFSMPELVAYGSADFPPGPATVTTLGELPHRRGKALIVRVPPRRGLDPALLDPTGAALPLRVRAVDANELRTLVAYSREGDVHVLSVYDLEAKLRVARYVLDGWPDFSFGERGRIDAGQLVKLMPEAR